MSHSLHVVRRPRHAAWAVLLLLAILTTACAVQGADSGTPHSRNPSISDPRPPVPTELSATGTPGPNGSQALGLAEDLQYLTGADLGARLDAYARLGVQWARFQLIWANVQRSSPNEWSWSSTDAVVAGLEARGIRPLAVLGTTPPWASRVTGCQVDTCGPTNPEQFATFAATAAARYAGRVQAWEVWNEPNIDTFYKPSPDPVAYAALLRAVGPALHAGDPAATVLFGGPAPADDSVDPADGHVVRIQPVSFLARAYTAGVAGTFDAVGWHPYSYPAPPGGLNPTSTWVQMYGSAASVREIMTSNGDEAKPVWGTEFGAPTAPASPGSLTEAEQAVQLGGGIDLWRRYTWTGPLFLYQLRDRGTDPADREDFFGLQRHDGSPKLAYDAVAARVVH